MDQVTFWQCENAVIILAQELTSKATLEACKLELEGLDPENNPVIQNQLNLIIASISVKTAYEAMLA